VSRFERGATIAGRFVIEGRLASGGMAEVWVAEMSLARGVARRVAIKRIHPHLVDDPDFVTMFLDEARVSSQLSHAGLVPVLDAVEHDSDVMLVLELVPGWDLRAILRQMTLVAAKMPVPVVLQIARDLADTLTYVHGAKDRDGKPLEIVHRDVSPANVLIADDGSVRLLDFGVAKAAARATRTATATLKGKVAYAAPEQILGKAVTQATDLYAFGLVVFELATGHKALDAPDQLATIERARAPAHVAPSTLRPELPPELDALVLPLLAVAPEDRPASVAEVRDALEAIARSIPGVDRSAVRDFVTSLMPSTSRPIESASSGIEAALANVLGMRGAGAGTARVAPATPPPPKLAGTTVAPLDSVSAAPSEPRSDAAVPSRQWRSPLVATGALLLAAGVAAAIVLAAGDEQDAASAEPVATAEAPRGFLQLTSDPPGASVEIDSVPWAQPTPTVAPSPPGRERRVVFRLRGHAPVERRATAGTGAPAEVHAELVPSPGRLVVRSEPAGASVRVDGELRGVTPLTIDDAPRAALAVEVSKEGWTTHRETAPLDRDEEHVIEAVLSRRAAAGLLDVSSRPWARVRVGGRVVAESTPATGIRLPVGSHVVTLENPRTGATARRRVQIREGRTTQLVVELDHR
jgi:serine/threonine protein kinase